MPTKIYTAPKEIKKPDYDFRDIKQMEAEEKRYVDEVRAYCIKEGFDKLSGKQISIPHADSAAYYMVFSMIPLTLIKLEIGDEWDSEWADLLTPEKVLEMIRQGEGVRKLFGG